MLPSEKNSFNSSKLGHISGIDGLRALAVLVVMFYHADIPYVQGGYLGVEVFFVISGFLITKLLLNEASVSGGKINLALFWKRRAARLLPALLLLLCFVTLVGAFVLKDKASQYRYDIIASLLYYENWCQIYSNVSYFSDQGLPLLRHIWSLAVEEQFYFIWPLLVALLLRASKGKSNYLAMATLAFFTVSFSSMIFLTTIDNQSESVIADILNRAYLGTDTRAFAILAGALLAMVSMNTRKVLSQKYLLDATSLIAIAGILVSCSFLEVKNIFLYHGGFLLVDMLTLIVIYSFLKSDSGVLKKFFSIKPLEWVGKRSYGIYLWHWPVFKLLGTEEFGYDWIVLRFIVTFLLAEISFRFLETPVRQSISKSKVVKRRKTNKVVFASACSTMVVIMLWSGIVLSHQKPYVDEVQQSLAINAVAVDTDQVSKELSDVASMDSDDILTVSSDAGTIVGTSATNNGPVEVEANNTAKVTSLSNYVIKSGGMVVLQEQSFYSSGNYLPMVTAADLKPNDDEIASKLAMVEGNNKSGNIPVIASGKTLTAYNNESFDAFRPQKKSDNSIVNQNDMDSGLLENEIVPDTLKNIKITAIGDSVMKGAAIALKKKLGYHLGKNTVTINAEVSRSFGLAYNILLKYKQNKSLGDVVVIHLGTNNSSITRKEFNNLISLLSDRSLIVFLTVKSHKNKICENVNATLVRYVKSVPNARILDWKSLSDKHPEYFYSDHTHLRPDGAKFYASMVFKYIAGHVTIEDLPEHTIKLAKKTNSKTDKDKKTISKTDHLARKTYDQPSDLATISTVQAELERLRSSVNKPTPGLPEKSSVKLLQPVVFNKVSPSDQGQLHNAAALHD
ncbi:MAG: acyltransferase family protein [Geobacteraceae bacterium]|nr:acyltransferase family protein [Geobacteraceae bacterium]